jgi:hypothetical protein
MIAASVGSHIQYRRGCFLSGGLTMAVEFIIDHIKKCFRVLINSEDIFSFVLNHNISQFGSYHDHVIL